MSKPWLYEGARVVCVDGERIPGLKAGKIYTVTAVGESGGVYRGVFGKLLCVRLAEAFNPKAVHCLDEVMNGAYAADRFRPVSTIDTTPQVEALKKLVRNTVSRSPAMEGVRG